MKSSSLFIPLLLGLALLACGKDDERTIIREIAPAVEQAGGVACCDFDHRDRCRQYPLRLVVKPSFQNAHRICVEHGRCLTDCP